MLNGGVRKQVEAARIDVDGEVLSRGAGSGNKVE